MSKYFDLLPPFIILDVLFKEECSRVESLFVRYLASASICADFPLVEALYCFSELIDILFVGLKKGSVSSIAKCLTSFLATSADDKDRWFHHRKCEWLFDKTGLKREHLAPILELPILITLLSRHEKVSAALAASPPLFDGQ